MESTIRVRETFYVDEGGKKPKPTEKIQAAGWSAEDHKLAHKDQRIATGRGRRSEEKNNQRSPLRR